MIVGIIISNPNHHSEMTLNLVKKSQERNMAIEWRIFSLCEFRGLCTPKEIQGIAGKVIVAKDTKRRTDDGEKVNIGSSDSLKRRLLRKVFWNLFLRADAKKFLKGLDKVFLFNDAAFPMNHIVHGIKKQHLDFYLIQEGIRFDLPGSNDQKNVYGAGGAEKIFIWGDGQRSYFERAKSGNSQIVISGSPRFEHLKNNVSGSKTKKNSIGLFTNPVDALGYCSEKEKFKLIEDFLKRSKEVLEQKGITLYLKNHPGEDSAQYEALVQAMNSERMKYSTGNVYELFSKIDASIVVASTVGLESLYFNLPIAQLKIPDTAYIFDYVESGAATPLDVYVDTFAKDLDNFLERDHALSATEAGYINFHLNTGVASDKILDAIK